jgi:hypothetical protein
VEKDETMMSLYDYRGRRDYDKIGQKVFECAKKMRVKIQDKHIENPKYKGVVKMYPKWFLDDYFNDISPTTSSPLSDDELPF